MPFLLDFNVYNCNCPSFLLDQDCIPSNSLCIRGMLTINELFLRVLIYILVFVCGFVQCERMLYAPTIAFGLLLRTAIMTSALGQLICPTSNDGTYVLPLYTSGVLTKVPFLDSQWAIIYVPFCQIQDNIPLNPLCITIVITITILLYYYTLC